MIIFLDYKAFLGLAHSYRCKLIMRPLFNLCSSQSSLFRSYNDLLVTRSRTPT